MLCFYSREQMKQKALEDALAKKAKGKQKKRKAAAASSSRQQRGAAGGSGRVAAAAAEMSPGTRVQSFGQL